MLENTKNAGTTFCKKLFSAFIIYNLLIMYYLTILPVDFLAGVKQANLRA